MGPVFAGYCNAETIGTDKVDYMCFGDDCKVECFNMIVLES